METRTFNIEINKGNFNPFILDQLIICSYQFARSKAIYIKKIIWDLVVIDEAHRLRNVYKPGNKIANAVKDAVSEAPKILLTATPLQNSLLELYGLVSIIDDYTFGDLPSFKSQFVKLTEDGNFNDLKARLKPICQRTLRKQVLEYVKYTNRIPITQEFIPTDEEQKLYDLVSEYLQRANLYALPSGQRKLMTMILRKLLASSTYAISGTLEALSVRLDNIIKSNNEPEMLGNKLEDDYENYNELEDEWDEDDEDIKESYSFTAEQIAEIKQERHALKEFKELADKVRKNSKGEVLLTALKKGFSLAVEKGGKQKAILFTESRRTQLYLKNILENTEFKGKIVLFNGSNSDQESKAIYHKWLEKHKGTDKISGSRTADLRSALVECFRDEAVIMIATEAAAEGVNLQFCSLVVNYDLPWNPQRIEQRIGRCHRYGQRSDVVVVNFLNRNNEADQRVFELLSEKFKLFDGVFGASDEVLGRIESGVDFEKRIADIYQNCRTPEEIQVSFDQLQRDLEEQIDVQMSETRNKLLANFDEEVVEKLKVNLTQSRDYLSKYENWLWQITQFSLSKYATFYQDGFSFLLKANPFTEDKINLGPYRVGRGIDDVNIYRIGHPLAQKIIEKCQALTTNSKNLVFDYTQSRIRISILEYLVGKSGWISIKKVTVSSFESEDYIVLTGIFDKGEILDEEICKRMFSLPAKEMQPTALEDPTLRDALNCEYERRKKKIFEQIGIKNARFFEQELDKLDKWGEDKRNSLKITLKEYDDKIAELKKASRLAPNMPEKLIFERERRQFEAKRDEAWKDYDLAAKEITKQKDELLDNIQERLAQTMSEEELFTIHWEIK
jgi:ERCC4-related helicase